jgi:RHS repeat-associated protein
LGWENNPLQELDAETELYCYGARYCDPVLTRFIQADTLASLAPQSLNRYSYTLNNPILYTDPSGCSPQTCL